MQPYKNNRGSCPRCFVKISRNAVYAKYQNPLVARVLL